jgi:hypothetical protein
MRVTNDRVTLREGFALLGRGIRHEKLIFTVAILYMAGASLNVVTLSGLMLAVGMLIDNAVVVVENIFRHREGGTEPGEAAIDGAAEVGLAIVAGTLTTIIVFMPLFFMTPNMMGTQMREFGLSISFALVAFVWLLRSQSALLASLGEGLLPRRQHDPPPRGVSLMVFVVDGMRVYSGMDPPRRNDPMRPRSEWWLPRVPESG